MQTKFTRYHIIKPFSELIKTPHFPIRSGMSLKKVCEKTGFGPDDLNELGIKISEQKSGRIKGTIDRNTLFHALLKYQMPPTFSLRHHNQDILFQSHDRMDLGYISSRFRAIVARLAPLSFTCEGIFVPPVDKAFIGCVNHQGRIAEWVNGMATEDPREKLHMTDLIIRNAASWDRRGDILRSIAGRLDFPVRDVDEYLATSFFSSPSKDGSSYMRISTNYKDLFLSEPDPISCLPDSILDLLRAIIR